MIREESGTGFENQKHAPLVPALIRRRGALPVVRVLAFPSPGIETAAHQPYFKPRATDRQAGILDSLEAAARYRPAHRCRGA